jgi:hypothetical protein
MDRFLEAIKEYNKENTLYALFLGSEIGDDLETRQLVIDKKLINNIIFV